MSVPILFSLVQYCLFAILAFVSYKIFSILISPYASPLRDLPGPPNPNWLYGHLVQIFHVEACTLHEKWIKEYGKTFRYKGLFNVCFVLCFC